MTLDWEEQEWQLLAGQYSDVIASLTAPMLNFGVAGYAGNIGYRRPQLRLTKGLGPTELVLALSRTIGDPGPYSLGDSGEDSGIPTVQARFGADLPMGQSRPLQVAISGHWGREELETGVPGECDRYDTWSGVVQALVPLGDQAELMGEYFLGQNLDDYYGGIGQGINRVTCEEVAAKGGWLALRLRPTDRLSMSLGGGIDDPDNQDLLAGDRSRNRLLFGNLVYDLTPSVQVGLELSHWWTDYVARDQVDALRLQTAFMYHF